MPKMNAESADKAKKVQQQVDDVTKIMEQNVQDAMKRGEQLEDLEAKTATLEAGSRAFTQNTGKVKSNLWWQNMKYWAILIGVIVAIILIILVAVFGPKIFTG